MSPIFQADYALQLSGPTNFAPVILKAREHAKAVSEANGGQAYSVLLIITDGEITDMKETKHAIIGACEEPISVIIVGVGNCEFKKMTILDGDGEDGLTTKDGMKASRDIVQFVPFRDFKDDKEKLATATLAEFPAQVIEYLKSKNIQPKKD
jgi:copine 1/2/3